MPLIEKINDAYKLRKRFKDFECDVYPHDVYVWLIDYYDQIGEDVELDVIDIHCSLTSTDIDEYREYCADDITFQEMLELIKDNHIFIAVDDDGVVYYMG